MTNENLKPRSRVQHAGAQVGELVTGREDGPARDRRRDDEGSVAVALELARDAPVRADDERRAIQIGDAVCILDFLFLQQECVELACLDAADVNDSGDVDLTDAVQLLGWLFLGGVPPAPPAPPAP